MTDKVQNNRIEKKCNFMIESLNKRVEEQDNEIKRLTDIIFKFQIALREEQKENKMLNKKIKNVNEI